VKAVHSLARLPAWARMMARLVPCYLTTLHQVSEFDLKEGIFIFRFSNEVRPFEFPAKLLSQAVECWLPEFRHVGEVQEHTMPRLDLVVKIFRPYPGIFFQGIGRWQDQIVIVIDFHKPKISLFPDVHICIK